nr:COX15/CtaA family protein [Arthrobacter alpinus]
MAWCSFAAQVLVIATGGAVRLTSSGLGCPTWPLCTPDSLVSTPEMGVHGLIEFGNRTLTALVGGFAIIVLLLVIRSRRQRPDLYTLASAVLLGVGAQALVGGITVLTGLNPFIVGFHYLASMTLVCLCAAFLTRLRSQAKGTLWLPRAQWLKAGYWALASVTCVVIVLGVLTTGAGPHSGDPAAGRNGFNAVALQHIHAWPSYLLITLTFAITLEAYLHHGVLRTWLTALLGIQTIQALLGIYQARQGLPELAVGSHMVLAALLAATTTVIMVKITDRHRAEHRHAPANDSNEPRFHTSITHSMLATHPSV